MIEIKYLSLNKKAFSIDSLKTDYFKSHLNHFFFIGFDNKKYVISLSSYDSINLPSYIYTINNFEQNFSKTNNSRTLKGIKDYLKKDLLDLGFKEKEDNIIKNGFLELKTKKESIQKKALAKALKNMNKKYHWAYNNIGEYKKAIKKLFTSEFLFEFGIENEDINDFLSFPFNNIKEWFFNRRKDEILDYFERELESCILFNQNEREIKKIIEEYYKNSKEDENQKLLKLYYADFLIKKYRYKNLSKDIRKMIKETSQKIISK